MMIQKLPAVDSAAPPIATRPGRAPQTQATNAPEPAATVRLTAQDRQPAAANVPAETTPPQPTQAPPAVEQTEPVMRNIPQPPNPQKGTINLIA
jgi:hypothetical protein